MALVFNYIWKIDSRAGIRDVAEYIRWGIGSNAELEVLALEAMGVHLSNQIERRDYEYT